MITLDFFFGHDLFEFWHVLYLLISLLIIIFGSIFAHKHLKLATIEKICLCIGIVTEAMKCISYVYINEYRLHGYLSKGDLPFNLCSLQILFFIILVCVKNEKVLKAFRSFMVPTCLAGGSAALLLATSSSLNYLTITFQYFGFHCAIIIYAIYLISSKEFRLTLKDYIRTIGMLICLLFIAIYINSILSDLTYTFNEKGSIVDTAKNIDINYMYVVHGPKDDLPYLNTNKGWLVYILRYTLLCVVAVSCCYARPIIEGFKTLFKKIKHSN